jgi:hypothetical protein
MKEYRLLNSVRMGAEARVLLTHQAMDPLRREFLRLHPEPLYHSAHHVFFFSGVGLSPLGTAAYCTSPR